MGEGMDAIGKALQDWKMDVAVHFFQAHLFNESAKSRG